jgi:hypothetical protein
MCLDFRLFGRKKTLQNAKKSGGFSHPESSDDDSFPPDFVVGVGKRKSKTLLTPCIVPSPMWELPP